MPAAHTVRDRGKALLEWYTRSLRGFLTEHLPTELIAQLDNECTRVHKAISHERQGLICFIGESGIGKSTLLNALVAEERTVVPSGGIGPLTALATEVSHNEIPRFRAEYHPRAHFWRFAAALRFHAARLHAQKAEMPPPDDPTEGGSEEIKEEVSQFTGQESEGGPSRINEFISTAKLMIAGDQFADRTIEYLADALAVAYLIKPQWGTEPLPEDARRIERIQDALRLAGEGSAFTIAEGEGRKGFRDILRDHAAGFLSPLIRRIEVGWPSPLLKSGLVLVDLPGVGIAGDVYKKETQRFVREKARAVVLVTKRGVAESVMDLLKSTGYWNRLLLSSDDPSSDPCSLILAVTHVDELAAEEWRNQALDAAGRRPKSKPQVFVELCDRLRQSQKQQLEAQLRALVQAESGDASRAAREAAAKSLLDSLQVHPLSAVQYRMIASDNEDDQPFLKSLDQTGVPALRENLRSVANDLEKRQTETVTLLTRRFAEDLWNQLGLIETSLRRPGRAVQEAQRIRAILETALAEKNGEYKLRRASFRNFLKETVPEKIKSAVLEARIDAEVDVRKYLRRLQGEHWATLCAAVRKGGTHVGKHRVELPDDIAQMFLDPEGSV